MTNSERAMVIKERLAALFRGGTSVADLARTFDLSQEDVERAIGIYQPPEPAPLTWWQRLKGSR